MNQEKLIEINSLNERLEKSREKIEITENALVELLSLKEGIVNLLEQGNKTILSQIGKGSFVKARVEEDSVFVDVGAGIVIKKDYNSALVIVSKQIERAENFKQIFSREFETLQRQLNSLIAELEKE